MLFPSWRCLKLFIVVVLKLEWHESLWFFYWRWLEPASGRWRQSEFWLWRFWTRLIVIVIFIYRFLLIFVFLCLRAFFLWVCSKLKSSFLLTRFGSWWRNKRIRIQTLFTCIRNIIIRLRFVTLFNNLIGFSRIFVLSLWLRSIRLVELIDLHVVGFNQLDLFRNEVFVRFTEDLFVRILDHLKRIRVLRVFDGFFVGEKLESCRFLLRLRINSIRFVIGILDCLRL